MEEQLERLMGELERLDEEIEEVEGCEEKEVELEQLLKEEQALISAQKEADEQQKQQQSKVQELREEVKEEQELKQEMEKECEKLEKEGGRCDLDALQEELERLVDVEKGLFQESLKLMEQLKQIELKQQQSGQHTQQLESKIGILQDLNFAQRKGRELELGLREFEDKLWDKKRDQQQIDRKYQRLLELVHEDQIPQSNLQSLLSTFTINHANLDKAKDSIRQRKRKFDHLDEDSSTDELTESMTGYRELAKELDGLQQEENDLLMIEKIRKNYMDLEQKVKQDYRNKCESMSASLAKNSSSNEQRLISIKEHCTQLQLKFIPSLQKMIQNLDQEEQEILESKKQVLSEILQMDISLEKRLVTPPPQSPIKQIKNQDIELPLDEYVFDKHAKLVELVEEQEGQVREIKQLERRLKEFESGLKEYQQQLKEQILEDYLGQVSQQRRLQNQLRKQLESLDSLINEIECQNTGETESTNKEELYELKRQRDKLREEVDRLEVEGRELGNKQGEEVGEFRDCVGQLISSSEEEVDKLNQVIQRAKREKEKLNQLNFKQKLDKRQEAKQQLRRIRDDCDELERLLVEIEGALGMVWKDLKHLGEQEYSPVKGSGGGDFEKNKVVKEMNFEVQEKQEEFEELKEKKDKLKKQLQKYQRTFDSLILETSTAADYETLLLSLSNEEQLKQQAHNLLEGPLKQLKTKLEQQIEHFKQKRALIGDIRKEEKEKMAEILRVESALKGVMLRSVAMERELVNQQSMDFKVNKEKKQLSQQLLDQVLELKGKIKAKQEEVENQKEQVQEAVSVLPKMGRQLLEMEQLKAIYKKLLDLRRLHPLTDSLRPLQDKISQQEQAVESFIKDLLGGSQYECERKLKEAEGDLERMARKGIELNNGMNDLEIEMKRGGRKDPLGEERKEMAELEKMRKEVKTALVKLKNKLEEGGKKLSAKELEDMIIEIEELQRNKLQKGFEKQRELEERIRKKREQWERDVFREAEKLSILEDLVKLRKANQSECDELDKKIKQLKQYHRSFKAVHGAMEQNPDYESRQVYIQKLGDQNIDLEEKLNIFTEFLKKYQQKTNQQYEDEQLNKNYGLEEIKEQMKKEEEEVKVEIQKMLKEANSYLKQNQKRRQKLGDADIMENFKSRVDQLNEIELRLKEMEQETDELERILGNTGEGKGIREIVEELANLRKKKERMQQKLVSLRDKLKQRDLYREDPIEFPPVIKEVRDLRGEVGDIEMELEKLVGSVTFLKNKYGGVDIPSKVRDISLQSEDYRSRLQQLWDDLQILKELQEEFDGNTSDNEEEMFIDKLGVSWKGMIKMHQGATEKLEQVFDELKAAQKQISRPNISLEDLATTLSTLHTSTSQTKKSIDDLDSKVQQSKRVFMQMQVRETLRRRQQEVMELGKRLEQFVGQLNEVESDMQQEANRIKVGEEGAEKLIEVFDEMFMEVDSIRDEYEGEGRQLMVIGNEIEELKGEEGQKKHQFQLLKDNIRIKKQILHVLNRLKYIRSSPYNGLLKKYQANKPVVRKANYRATKGDTVDQLLADWLNTNVCPVPIKRLGAGYYMFGTKKIYAKIINGKLVIRVGGGYMSIDEFMFYYGAQELNKMIAFESVDDNDEIDLDSVMDGETNKKDLIKHSKDGQSIIGVQQMKKRFSPRAFSPRAGSPGATQMRKKNMGSPRNISTRTDGRESARSGLSGQISGRKSPKQMSSGSDISGIGSQSFLKMQKKKFEESDDGARKYELNIKEKRQQ